MSSKIQLERKQSGKTGQTNINSRARFTERGFVGLAGSLKNLESRAGKQANRWRRSGEVHEQEDTDDTANRGLAVRG